MQILSSSSLHELEVPVVNIQNSGFDLVLKTSDGQEILIEDGLTEMIVNKVSIPLADGTNLDYKSIVKDMVSDVESLKLLDSHFIGDIYERATGEHDGTGVKESILAKLPSQEEGLDEDKSATDEEKLAAMQAMLEAMKKALAEAEKKAEEAEKKAEEAEEAEGEDLAEQEAELKEQIEEITKALNSVAEKGKDAVEEMKQELKVEEVEVNNNTSTQVGEFDIAPSESAGTSTKSGISNITEEGEPKPEDSFTVNLDTESDSGAKGDFITNVSEPLFKGTGTPGSLVTFKINGGSYTAIIDANGEWKLPPIPSLPEGLFKYDATDSLGRKVSGSIEIDTSNELTQDLEADTGIDNADGITNQSQLVFIGTTDAGSSVVVKIDGKEYKSVADADGNWKVDLGSSIKDGSYDYVVVSTDVAGNPAQESGHVVVDTTIDASVSLVEEDDKGLSQTDGITNENSGLTFAGVIEEFENAYFEFNGVRYPVQRDENGHWQVTVAGPLPDGKYDAVLHVKDIAGTESEIKQLITIDTKIDVFEARLDEESDSGDNAGDSITKETMPIFSGLGEPNAQVVLTINEKSYTTTVGADGKWSVQVKDELPEGEFEWRADVTDEAGNKDFKEGVITIATSVDISVKLVTDSGDDQTDGLTNETNNKFEGSTKANSTVEVTIKDENGKIVLKQNVPVDEDGNFVLETGEFPQGVYSYTFNVEDVAGNTNKRVGSFEVDTETFIEGGLDSESDKGHFSDDGVTKEQNPFFSGKGEAGSKVTVTINGKEYHTVVGDDEKWSVQVKDKLPEGEHKYLITSEDRAGNTAPSEGGSITIDTTDPSGLTARMSSPSDSGDSGDWKTNSKEIELEGEAEVGCKVSIIIDGRKYDDIPVSDGGSWSFKIPAELPENLKGYDVVVISEDLAGNVIEVNKVLVVDRSTSITGGLDAGSDTGHSDSDDITNKPNPVFSGTGEPNSDVVLTINGINYSGSTDSKGNWKITVDDALSDGEYDYSISITDQADNTEAIGGSIEVDSVAPSYIDYVLENDLGDSKGDFITSQNSPILTGEIEEGASLKIVLSGENGFRKEYLSPRDISIDENGVFEFKSPIPLDDGVYDIEFTVTDVAGNDLVKNQRLEIDTNINVTGDLKAESDSGISDSDKITFEKKPVFIGTGDAGDKITFTINSKDYHTTVKEDGTWSITVGDELKDSKYDWSVVASDVAGNTTRALGTVEIDTDTFMEGKLDSDSDTSKKDGITYETNPWFSGTGEIGATVTLSINGETYSTVVDATGSWSVEVTDSLPEKEYTYTLTIEDPAGNTKSMAGKVEIDTSTTVSATLDTATDSGTQGDLKTNDVNPIISGDGEAGSSIKVLINNREYVTTVGGDGKWSVKVDETLSHGTYKYTVESIDIAGNQAKATGAIEIDTKTTVTARLADGIDTGESSTDSITNKDVLAFVGKGEPDSKIVLIIGNDEYTTTVDEDGNWKIDGLRPLSDDNYNWSVVSTDEAGNKAHAGGTVTIDTQDPDFTPVKLDNDTGVDKGDFLTKNPDLTLSGSTEDDTITLTVKIGGHVFRSGDDFTVNKDGSWSFAIPNTLAEGNYKLEIFYKDKAGNESSETHKVVVDLSNSVDVALSTESDSGDKGDSLTNKDKPVFEGSTDALADVVLTINGIEYTAKADADGKFAIEVGNSLPDGEWEWTVTSIDPAGNDAHDKGVIEVDTKPPSLENIRLNNDSNVDGDWVTNNEQLELSGVLEAGAKLDIVAYKGGVRYSFNSLKDFTIDDQGNWAFTLPNSLEDGEWTLSFSATDKAGNPNSKLIKVTVDNTIDVDGHLDSLSDTGISQTDGFTSEKLPLFKGTGDVGSSIILNIGDNKFETVVAEDGSWSIKVDSPLPDNTYKVSVTATDIAGNVMTQNLPDLVVDTRPPASSEIELLSDTGLTGDWVTNVENPTFTGKVESGSIIEFTINDVTYTNSDMSIDEDGKWELTISENLVDGVYDWSISVTDKAGNPTKDSGKVEIDTQISLEGGLSDVSNSADKTDSLTNINTPTFSGKADANSKITLTINGVDYTGKSDGSGVWSIKVKDQLPDDTYKWVVKAEDEAGNVKEISDNVQIDTAKPDCTISLVNDTGLNKTDGVTNQDKPIFKGNIEPESDIRVTIAGVTYDDSVINVESDGSWSLVLPSSLGDDKYDVSMQVTDKAGNTTTKVIQIEVDTGTVLEGRLDAESDSGVESDDGVTNVTKPVFTGTGEAGAVVSLIINGRIYETEVTESKTWRISVTDELKDGDYTYTIKSTDGAGNSLETGGKVTIKGSTFIDARLDALSDTGLSSTDSYTRETKLTFSGKTDPSASLVLSIGGVEYPVSADQNGNWSYTLPSDLAHGKYNWSITTTDIAGNTAKENGVVEIDTETEITSELEAGSNSGDKSDDQTNVKQPWFGGSGEAGATVTVEINSKKYTTTVDEYGKWRVQVTDDLPEGKSSWTATIVDKAGNQKQASGEIDIDTGTHVKCTLDSATDSGDFSNDGITKFKQPAFKGTGEAGSTIVFVINGDTYKTVVDDNGNWSVKTSVDLPDNNYPWSVIATDKAGNTASQSGTITVDTTNTVTAGLDDNSNSSDKSDTLTNDNKPWFSGTGEAGATISLTINGKTYTTTVADNETWRVQVKDVLSDNEYDWTVTSSDIAGNEVSTTGVVSIDTYTFVKGGMDSAYDSGALDNDEITNEERPWFSGTGQSGSEISLVIDGREYTTTVGEDGRWSVKVDFRLPAGDNPYTITATDAAGNKDTVEGTAVIDLTTSVTAKLDSGSDSGLKGDDVTNVTNPWFSGTGDAKATIELTINGETYTTTVGEDGKWKVQVGTPLSEDDNYSWTVKATDVAGNTAETSGVLEIDTVTPLTAKLDGASNSADKSDAITNVNKPLFSGTGEAGSTIVLKINDQSYTTKVLEDGTWSVKVDDVLSDAKYDWVVESTDEAGNKAQRQGQIEVDTVTRVDGELESGSDTGLVANYTSDTTPTFSGTGEAGAEVVLVINMVPYTTTVAADRTWSITLPSELKDGVYEWKATLTDKAGNKAETGGTVTIDTTIDIDGSMDSASDTGASSNDGLTSNTRPSFAGTGEAGAKVTLVINNKEYHTTVDSNEKWAISVSDELPEGIYSWTADIVDGAGNTKSIGGEIEIDTSTSIEGRLDQASDSGDSDSDNITNVTTPTINGTGEVGAKVKLTINGKDYHTTVLSDKTWFVQIQEELPEDTYDWVAVSTDKAGNTHTDTGSIKIDTSTVVTGQLESASDSGINGDNVTLNKTPWFNGTGEAGSTITLKINGKSYTTVVEADNTWRVQVTDELPDNKHHWTVEAKDVAGNVKSTAGDVEIDTVTSVTARLAQAEDTGSSVSDGTTKSENIIFSGTGEAGSNVVFEINGQIFKTTVSADKTWSVTVGALDGSQKDGISYTWKVTSTDKTGNAESATGSITVDTTDPSKPTLSLRQADDSGDVGDWSTNRTDMVLSGTADFGTVVVVKVGSESHNIDVEPDGSWSLDLSGVPEGNHTVTIISTDKAGNTSTNTKILSVDQSNVVNGGIDSGSDKGTLSTDGVTNVVRPDFSGNTDANSSVKLTITSETGVKTELNTVADATGKWVISGDDLPDILADGNYTYIVESTDPVENTVSHSGNFTIDTAIRITVDIDDLTNSSDKADTVTNYNKVRVSGNVDAGDKVEVKVFDKDTGAQIEIIKATVNSDGSWYADTASELPDGLYEFRAKVTDLAGNVLVKKVEVTVDTKDPEDLTVNLHSESDTGTSGNWMTQDNTPRFVGTVEAGCKVELFINNKTYYAQVDADGNWEALVSDVIPDGKHSFKVTAVDVAGNTTEYAGNITIDKTNKLDFDLTDGQDTGWLVTDGVTSENKPVYIGSTDPFSVVTVTMHTVGAEKSTVVLTADSKGDFTLALADFFTGDNVPDGSYDFTVVSVDQAGNKAVKDVSIQVDTLAPRDLTVELDANSDTGAVKGDWITSDNKPVFTGTVEAGAKVWITINGKTHPITVKSDGTWSFGLPELPDGKHEWTVRAEDLAGNPSIESGSITVDTIDPTDVTGALSRTCETGIYINDGVTNKNSNLVFEGTTEPNTTVKVVIEGVDYEANVRSDGTWSVTVDKVWSDGKYDAQVVAEDAAGNVTDDVYFNFEVDTVKPSISEAGLHASDDHGTLSTDGVTNINNPRVVGKGSTDVVRVYLKFDGDSRVIEGVVNPDGTFEIQLSDVSDGTYQYTVFVEDRAGNFEKSASKPLVIDTQISATVSLDTSADSGKEGDWVTNVIQPKIKVGTQAQNLVTLEVKDASGVVVYKQTTRAISDSVLFEITKDLADGHYTYRVQSSDKAGNVNVQDGRLEIKTDTVVTGSLDKASDTGETGDNLTNLRNPTFSGKADPDATVTVALTGDFNGMHEVRTFVVKADGSGNWSIRISDSLSSGDYSYKITAVDHADNTSSQPQTGTISVDLTAPNLTGDLNTDTGVDDADKHTAGILSGTQKGHLDFVGSSTSDDLWKIQIVINGKTYTVPVNGDGTWEYVIPDKLADGTYTYQIFAFDKAGNKTEVSGSVKLDTQVVTTPKLSEEADTGEKGDNLTNWKKPAIAGTGESGLTITATLSGHDIGSPVDLGQTTTDKDGKWLYELSNIISFDLTDGAYTVNYSVVDAAGNTHDGTYTFNVDRTPPVLDVNEYNGKELEESRPLISGTTEANCKVYLIIDGETYNVTSDSSGNWKFEPSDMHMLPDGEIHYTIRTFDKAGNKTESHDFFYVNTGTSVEGGLSIDDDTGFFDTDGVTQVKTPTFRGIGDANADITITIRNESGAVVHTFTTKVDRNGIWTFKVPDDKALADGKYTYTVDAKDDSDNTASTEEKDLVIDNDITVETCRPWTGSYSGGRLVDGVWHIPHGTWFINGKLANNDVNARVTVEIDGKHYVGYTDKGGNYSIRIPLGDGFYNAKISFDDAAGNSVTQEMKIKLDTSTDEFSVKNDDDVNGDAKHWIVGTSHPTFSGSQDSEDAWQVSIRLYGLENYNYTFQLTKGTGDWSYTIPSDKPILDGSYSYDIIYWEQSGRYIYHKGSLVVDTTNELIGVEDMDKQFNADGDWIGTKMTGFSEGKADISIYIDGVLFDTVKASAGGSWSVDLPFAANGEYDIKLVSTDVAKNECVFEDPVVLDFIEAMNIDVPNGGEFNPRTTPLGGTGDAGIALTIKLTNESGQVITKYVSIQEDGKWSVDLTGLPDGTYSYEVLGNTTWDSKTLGGDFVVNATAPEIESVTLDTDSGEAGDWITNVVRPTISGKVEADAVKVIIEIGGTKYTSGVDFTLNSDGTWVFTRPTDMADGKHNFKVTAVDNIGNESVYNGAVTVLGSKPEVESATLLNDTGDSGDWITSNQNPSFTGKVSEFVSSMKITFNGVEYVSGKDFYVAPDGSWSLSIPANLADKDYVFRIDIADAAGNTNSFEKTLTVDTVAPTCDGGLSPDSDAGNGLTGDVRPTFGGTGKEGSTIVVTIDGKEFTTNVGSDGKWQLTWGEDLSEGQHLFVFHAVDAAGNKSNPSYGLVVVDVTAPTVTASPDDGGDGNVESCPVFNGTGEVGAVVHISINGETHDVNVQQDGNWSFTWPTQLTEGAHTVEYSSTDAAGNTSATETVGINVEAQAPIAPENLEVTDSVVVFSGTAEAGDVIEVTVDNSKGEVIADAHGAWTAEITLTDLGDYTYSISLTDSDNATSVIQHGTISYIDSSTVQAADYVVESDGSNDVTCSTDSPVFTGTADAGTTVTLEVEGKPYTTTVHEDGTWTLEATDSVTNTLTSYSLTEVIGGAPTVTEGSIIMSAPDATNTESGTSGTDTGAESYVMSDGYIEDEIES